MSPVDRFLIIFLQIVFEAMPFIILGALISGTLEELLPQQMVTRLLPKRRSTAIAGSALLGLIFPMCECGIVPVMRRLLGKGLPLSCAVAYMLAAPIINPVVIMSTWAAFKPPSGGERVDGLDSFQMVSLRVGLAFVTAFIVGLIIERLSKKHGDNLVRPLPKPHTHEKEDAKPQAAAEEDETTKPVHDAFAAPELQKKTVGQRLASISETALRDFIDIGCFLVMGAALAAIVQGFKLMDNLPTTVADPIFGPLLIVPAMMLLAILLCLCSEADAFVAAGLIQVPLGGKLAFLVLGPMLDLKLYLMYTRVFRSRLIWTIIPSVVILVFLLSLGAHYLDYAAR